MQRVACVAKGEKMCSITWTRWEATRYDELEGRRAGRPQEMKAGEEDRVEGCER
jgi:hypothetical protein